MPSVIKYEKYKEMNIRQLTNSWLNAKKKLVNLETKFKAKISNQKELISYLSVEIQSKVKEPKEYTLETAPSVKEAEQRWIKNPQGFNELKQDIETEMKGYNADNNTAQS